VYLLSKVSTSKALDVSCQKHRKQQRLPATLSAHRERLPRSRNQATFDVVLSFTSPYLRVWSSADLRTVMGRRLSTDKPPRKARRKESEGKMDYPNKPAAGEGPSSETQTSLGPALTPQKSYPSTSEHDTAPEAAESLSSFYLASASSSSSELAQQMSPRDIRSHSKSSQIDRLDSTAKSLLSSTGRALMRHASKLSVASSISYDRDEEGKIVWKLSGLGAAADSAAHSKSWRSKMCIVS